MNLTSKKIIRSLLKKNNIQPSKRLGQNFLVNKKVLADIITAAEISSKDIILEIGPGLGVLTKELALRAKKVIAVEKDERMIKILKKALSSYQNIKLIHADILRLPDPKIKNYKVIANLPYYIVAPVIRKFLEAKLPPKSMVLMVQKEVAQRICAKPPHMNLLSVSVQFYAEPKIIRYVKRTSFWPQPKVDGAIIKIVPSRKYVSQVNPQKFFKIVHAGFSHPRKQLVNNLSRHLHLDRSTTEKWLLKNGVQPSQRAETVSVESWISLTRDKIY